MLRHLLYVALVVRLVIDMATPLMPGAYRFNTEESVEVVRAHGNRVANQTTVRASTPSRHRTVETVEPIGKIPPVTARLALHATPTRPPHPRQTPAPLSESPEDH